MNSYKVSCCSSLSACHEKKSTIEPKKKIDTEKLNLINNGLHFCRRILYRCAHLRRVSHLLRHLSHNCLRWAENGLQVSAKNYFLLFYFYLFSTGSGIANNPCNSSFFSGILLIVAIHWIPSCCPSMVCTFSSISSSCVPASGSVCCWMCRWSLTMFGAIRIDLRAWPVRDSTIPRKSWTLTRSARQCARAGSSLACIFCRFSIIFMGKSTPPHKSITRKLLHCSTLGFFFVLEWSHRSLHHKHARKHPEEMFSQPEIAWKRENAFDFHLENIYLKLEFIFLIDIKYIGNHQFFCFRFGIQKNHLMCY